MDLDYAEVSRFAQTWGLVFLVCVFLGGVIYALWPSNKKRFDRASRMPLEDDDTPKENDRGEK